MNVGSRICNLADCRTRFNVIAHLLRDLQGIMIVTAKNGHNNCKGFQPQAVASKKAIQGEFCIKVEQEKLVYIYQSIIERTSGVFFGKPKKKANGCSIYGNLASSNMMTEF